MKQLAFIMYLTLLFKTGYAKKTYGDETRADSHKKTKSEEESLVHWILSLDQHGAARRPVHIRKIADILHSKWGHTTSTTNYVACSLLSPPLFPIRKNSSCLRT